MRLLLMVSSVLLFATAGCSGSRSQDAAGNRIAQLRSDSIILPEDSQSFADVGGDPILDHNCLACHSVTMVRYQPRLKPEQWKATVEKMRDAYGAPIADADLPAITAALTQLQSKR